MDVKKEKEDQFEWWITCIPDKIIALKKRVPGSVVLDNSLSSLNGLEDYLLQNFTLKSIQEDKVMWDSCASYLGQTYRKNVQGAEWYIELENERNVFYNMPSLRTNELYFVPHSYITTLFERRKGNFLSSAIEKHIKYLAGKSS